MSIPQLADLAVGEVVVEATQVFDRARLVKYAGASGDFNPIHWSESFAAGVGLPGVIAHGMLTMGAAVTCVEEWAGDPGAIVDYQTRFSRPVPVPDDASVTLNIVGKVGVIDLEAGTVRVDLNVTFEGTRVLTKAQAVVRLS